ncbi:hypothetical protein ACEQ8H_005855 [Pleosporales sp. CAS-2024a]
MSQQSAKEAEGSSKQPATELSAHSKHESMLDHDISVMIQDNSCPSDGDDDASSVVSETSTVAFEHEPYSTFQDKVFELCKVLFPNKSAQDIELERMQGGSFNRIIGITLWEEGGRNLPWYSTPNIRNMFSACVRGKSAKAVKRKSFVVRIPRNDIHHLCYQSIILMYVGRVLGYQVPKCITYDSGINNPLSQSYMLQNRLPGQSLAQLWPHLSIAQRRAAARCIAEVVRDLHRVRNPCAGVISLRNTSRDLDTGVVQLEPMMIPGHGKVSIPAAAHVFKTRVATPQTTRNLLLSLIARQRIRAEEDNIPAALDHIWSGFTAMINKIYADGFLPDHDTFSLFHPHLYARNLLFIIPTPSTVHLSGIMDWDNTLFAPKFMATRAPFFLWQDDVGADEHEEDQVLIEPSESSEEREFKRIFEKVVGAQFFRDSYRPEYIFLRRIWRFLECGIRSGMDQYFAQEILEQWADK